MKKTKSMTPWFLYFFMMNVLCSFLVQSCRKTLNAAAGAVFLCRGSLKVDGVRLNIGVNLPHWFEAKLKKNIFSKKINTLSCNGRGTSDAWNPSVSASVIAQMFVD